jgi:XTP/dITP diphosphohydrolase
MRLVQKILFASTNRLKFLEFQSLFQTYSFELLPAEKLLSNPRHLQDAERHSTYLENAMSKAKLAQRACHYPTLADDSGLEVDALDGKPGVLSRRFTQAFPQASSPQEALLKSLKEERKATFVCVLSFMMEGISLHVEARVRGMIASEPRGERGFGYDALFIPEGQTKTFAEMTLAEKNTLSHRACAFQMLLKDFEKRGLVLVKP